MFRTSKFNVGYILTGLFKLLDESFGSLNLRDLRVISENVTKKKWFVTNTVSF